MPVAGIGEGVSVRGMAEGVSVLGIGEAAGVGPPVGMLQAANSGIKRREAIRTLMDLGVDWSMHCFLSLFRSRLGIVGDRPLNWVKGRLLELCSRPHSAEESLPVWKKQAGAGRLPLAIRSRRGYFSQVRTSTVMV